MTNEEREFLEYIQAEMPVRTSALIEHFRMPQDECIDMLKTLEAQHLAYRSVDLGWRVGATGRAALAQTASESAAGDVDLSTMLDDVDGVMPDINSLPERLAVAEDEIQRLTRELEAANAKIESALAIERYTSVLYESKDYIRGANDARDDMRKRLTTDD